MHLVSVILDAYGLVKHGVSCGMQPSEVAADPAYATHGLLRAAWGDAAPRPFRVLESGSEVRVIGYSDLAANDLAQRVTQAPDLAKSAFALHTLKTWEAPSIDVGQTLRFDLLTTPVRRNEKGEKDAFLHALDRGLEVTREEAYRAWLVERFEGVAELVDLAVRGFSLSDLHRKKQRVGEARREKCRVRRPVVNYTGVVRIADSARFSRLVREGVGRGKGLGLGMLVLKPA